VQESFIGFVCRTVS